MCIEKLKLKKDLNSDEINLLLNAEKDIKVYKKLLYIKYRQLNISRKKACKLLNIPQSTTYHLDNQWEKGGYNALVPNYGGGRESKLSNKQIEDLKIKLNTQDSWLVDDVKNLIEKHYGVKYGYHGVRNLLIKLKIPIANYFQIENDYNKKINIKKNYDKISNNKDEKTNKIIKMMNNETSVFVYKKLHYLLLRELGLNNNQATELLDVTPATGSNWNNRWKNEGYKGLLRKKGQGRKTKLSKEEIELLKKN